MSNIIWKPRHIAAFMIAALLGACASDPAAPRDQAYNDYWQCARQAVQPHINDQRLTAREVAMRAQAKCNSGYHRYRTAQMGFVRSKVPSRDYDMANTLGAQSAFEHRRLVTRTLTDYVSQARAGR
ncbi:MAG: hypothetical protein PF501_20440 [Salinisphaera sp.]|jgi:hypothetical protein|nr:hypothetical protein [Salinisphaera sp.]